MGAAYVVTGSVNQACVESGTSDAVRRCSAQAQQADIAMAPAADMFEMGVKVQVLKRGTMFAMRAAKLYELYRAHDSLDQIPAADRGDAREDTSSGPRSSRSGSRRSDFFRRPRPGADRAGRARSQAQDGPGLPLVPRACRRTGPTRASRRGRVDYQIWCGPAMAAFNEWVEGRSWSSPRTAGWSTVALNILYGAAVLTRARMPRRPGGPRCPPGAATLAPLDSRRD